MANPRLQARYQSLFDATGAQRPLLDDGQWDHIVSTVQDLKEIQYLDVATLSAEQVKARSDLLKRCGGIWGARLNQLTPMVIEASRRSFDKFFGGRSSRFAFPDPDDILFGEFPTQRFNASAISTEDGNLILINSGLMDVLSQLCSIQSTARHAVTGQFDRAIALEGASKHVLACALKYQRQWSFVIIQDQTPTPQLTELDLALNDFTLQAMLVFVAGHEVAHAVLKHHGRDWGVLRHKWIRETTSPQWQMELTADLVGVEIMIQWCAAVLSSGQIQDEEMVSNWLASSIVGPLFYFECERMFAACAEGRGWARNQGSESHPPSVQRQAFVTDYLRQRLGRSSSLGLTRLNRQFIRTVRRRLESWQDAGILLQQVDVIGGSDDDLKGFLADVSQTPEFESYWKDRHSLQ